MGLVAAASAPGRGVPPRPAAAAMAAARWAASSCCWWNACILCMGKTPLQPALSVHANHASTRKGTIKENHDFSAYAGSLYWHACAGRCL